MPRFSEDYDTLQGASVPPAGPVSAALTLGFWFRLSAPAEFVGWRYYTAAGEKGLLYGQLWDTDEATLLAIGTTSLKLTLQVQAADGWRHLYAHPRAKLVADHDYLLAVGTDGNGVFRTPDAFISGSVSSGIITAPQHKPSSVDFNGVFLDPMSFNNPPVTVSGHLYGIDMLILPD